MSETDWSRFGGDPTPGEPSDIQRAIGFVKDAQANGNTLLGFFQRIQSHGDQIVWEGLSAGVFKEEMSLLLPDIRKVIEAGDSLIAALKNYQFQLETLKASAATQGWIATQAQSAIKQAQTKVTWARQEIARIKAESAAAHSLAGTTMSVDTSHFEQIVHQASQDLAYQRSQLDRSMREIDFLRGESQSLRRNTAVSIDQSSYFKVLDETPLSRIFHGMEHFASIALRTEKKAFASEYEELKAGAKKLAGAEVRFVEKELGGREAVESLMRAIENTSNTFALGAWGLGKLLSVIGFPEIGAAVILVGTVVQAVDGALIWQYKSAQFLSGQISKKEFALATGNLGIDAASAFFGVKEFNKATTLLENGSRVLSGASRAGAQEVSQGSLTLTEAISSGPIKSEVLASEIKLAPQLLKTKLLEPFTMQLVEKHPDVVLSGIKVVKGFYTVGNDLSPYVQNMLSTPDRKKIKTHPMDLAKDAVSAVPDALGVAGS